MVYGGKLDRHSRSRISNGVQGKLDNSTFGGQIDGDILRYVINNFKFFFIHNNIFFCRSCGKSETMNMFGTENILRANGEKSGGSMESINSRVLNSGQSSELSSGSGYRKAKRVLMVSSIAGVAPGPGSAVYSASKAFLNSFSLSLRRELLPHGVLVTLAMPGPVASGFSAVANAENALIFNFPGLCMTTDKTAAIIYSAMKQGRDSIVPGFYTINLKMFLS